RAQQTKVAAFPPAGPGDTSATCCCNAVSIGIYTDQPCLGQLAAESVSAYFESQSCPLESVCDVAHWLLLTGRLLRERSSVLQKEYIRTHRFAASFPLVAK